MKDKLIHRLAVVVYWTCKAIVWAMVAISAITFVSLVCFCAFAF